MKINKFFYAVTLFAAIVFAACGTPDEPDKPDKPDNPDQPSGVELISVEKAIEIINALDNAGQTDVEYQIQGTVKVVTKAADIESGKYTNLNLNLTDATGTLYCVFTNGLNNEPVTAVSQIPAEGTELILQGKLKKYVKDDKVTPEMVNGFIVKIVKEGSGEQPSGDVVAIPSEIKIPDGALTIAQARAKCAALADKATTGDKFYVHGWIKKLHKNNTDGINNYGNAQFYMAEKKYTSGEYDADDFMAFQVYGANGEKLVNVNQVAEGDYVVIYGELTNYGGTYETVGKGAAYIYASTNPNFANGQPEEANVIEATIAEALAAGNALEDNASTTDHYKVSGAVKEITDFSPSKDGKSSKENGYGNATFTIADEAGNELTIFRTKYLNGELWLAENPELAVGDVITVQGPIKKYKAKDADPVVELVNGMVIEHVK